MVRRSVRVVMLCCMLAAILAQPIAASAASYTVYDGNMSSTYTTIFRDIVGKIDPFEDYVYFRSGQHEYVLIAGDLTYDVGTFTGESCTEYSILIDTDYSAGYVYSETEISSFSLDPGSALVYSNLEHYPDLIDRNSFYSFASLVLLLICVFMYLIRSIFSFTLRRR